MNKPQLKYYTENHSCHFKVVIYTLRKFGTNFLQNKKIISRMYRKKIPQFNLWSIFLPEWHNYFGRYVWQIWKKSSNCLMNPFAKRPNKKIVTKHFSWLNKYVSRVNLASFFQIHWFYIHTYYNIFQWSNLLYTYINRPSKIKYWFIYA